MKKIFATLFAFAAIASMTMLASCGGAPSNEEIGKIVDKYEDDAESLTESDYNKVFDYFVAASNEQLDICKDIDKAREDGDKSKVEELENRLQETAQKYEYLYEVGCILLYAEGHGVSDFNLKKIEKLKEKAEKQGRSLNIF